MTERVEELEARAAWHEKQLADLDQVVRELFAEVVRLRREVDALQENASRGFSTTDEKPPHY